MTHRPPLHADLIMTMPDGTVTDGRYSTIAAVTTKGTITMADGDGGIDEPRWFQKTEFGFASCKPPVAWRLKAELADQREVL